MPRLLREWLGCLAAVLACALLLQCSGVLERVDLAVYDMVLRLDSRPVHPDILVVAVDEASVQALGRWPWPRERHAELLDRLSRARPRAVALDMLFTEPSPADGALARSLATLREHSAVFLPMTLGEPLARGRVPQPLLPLPAFGDAASGLGHIHVELDGDSVARSLYLREGLEGSVQWDALSALLARASGAPTPPRGPDAPRDGTGWQRASRMLIPFSGGPGAYRSVPYVSVLRGEVPEPLIRDKIVLVGLTAAGAGDRYPTPVSGAAALTPGVEINAAAVDGLLADRMLRPVSPQVQALACGLALLAWMACLWRLGPRGGVWGLAAFALAALAATATIQAGLRWWLPVASWVLPALLGYLLWSWRRLAVLLSDLYRRAEALRPDVSGPARRDGWQDVVEALDRGLLAEQQMQQQRNEALQLLSHDLRAPQSAILALLSGTGRPQDARAVELHGRIEQQVRATLGLADDFVMQLRAEGDTYDWQEVDLAQLVIDACDRAWPLATAKRIALEMQLPRADGSGSVEACWMRVDPRMLGRAFFNLVENAIKYSPAGTTVWVALAWQLGEDASFSVRDQGVGVAAEDLPHLFERYRRVGDMTVASGHGLGLSLVKTVAERHGGQVCCDSEPGVGSVFTLTLPAECMLA